MYILLKGTEVWPLETNSHTSAILDKRILNRDLIVDNPHDVVRGHELYNVTHEETNNFCFSELIPFVMTEGDEFYTGIYVRKKDVKEM